MTSRFRFHPDPVKPAPLHLVSLPDVTPLLGVLIVLLVSYVSSLPQQEALDVILPPQEARLVASASPAIVDIIDPLCLQISPDGDVDINGHPIPLDQLRTRLALMLDFRKNKEVYVSAAPNLRYGKVTQVIDAMRGSGVAQIVMVPSEK